MGELLTRPSSSGMGPDPGLEPRLTRRPARPIRWRAEATPTNGAAFSPLMEA